MTPRTDRGPGFMSERFWIFAAASDEALALGDQQLDVDHIVVGLLTVGGASARALAAAGIDLRAVRAAARRLHDLDVSALGISTEHHRSVVDAARRPGRVILPSNSRVDEILGMTAPALDDRPLLIALLDDGGGRAERLLSEAGIDVHELRARLSGLESAASVTAEESNPHADSGGGWAELVAGAADSGVTWMEAEYSQTVPVSLEQVWELVDGPLRRPEWDPSCVRITPSGDGMFQVAGPDGPTTTASVLRRVQDSLIAWGSFSSTGEHLGILEVMLEPDGVGTTLHLRCSWPTRGRASGRLSRLLLTRMVRTRLRIQAQGIANAA